jgi:two-component system chemotaxis response regulator CheB
VTRVLVVDDSALVRRLMAKLLADEAEFETAFARNGVEALEALSSFEPDVVTLDINMPDMDGLACLDRIMLERPTPVVMVSSLTTEGASQSVEALALGAVDVVQKPDGSISLAMETFGPSLLEKIRSARGARIRRTHRLTERVRRLTAAAVASRESHHPGHRTAATAPPEPVPEGVLEGLVLVGCSTGGPPALDALLGRLPDDFPWPIVVAQHMPAAFTGPLARRLDSLCRLPVMEVTQPTPLAPGRVYIGRGDADVVISETPEGPAVLPAPSSRNHAWHPSVDRLVETAMAVQSASRIVGILMTGMGYDGAAAMTQLRRAGGWTLAEAEETAVVWGMPGELVRTGGAAAVAPLHALAARLIQRTART